MDLLRVPWPTAATCLTQHAGAGGPPLGVGKPTCLVETMGAIRWELLWMGTTVEWLRNLAPVNRWFIPLFLGFLPSQVAQDFATHSSTVGSIGYCEYGSCGLSGVRLYDLHLDFHKVFCSHVWGAHTLAQLIWKIGP